MDKPEPGKLYALTGAPGLPSIASGDSWAESAVGAQLRYAQMSYATTGRCPLAYSHRCGSQCEVCGTVERGRGRP